jgi:hypothetical protein
VKEIDDDIISSVVMEVKEKCRERKKGVDINSSR